MSEPQFPVRVLVVDDSTMMRALIRRALQGRSSWSAEVIEAGDGVEALELIRNPKLDIDVVLLDWNMPRLDGIGFLKALKACRSPGEVAVIMVTTQSQQSSVAEALRWGARDYLLKPFKEETLRERVGRAANRTTTAPDDTAVLLRRAAGEGANDAPFLQTIPAEAAQELLLKSPPRVAPAGAALLLPGLRTDVLGIVLRGQVELMTPGKEPGRDVRGPGDCWGEAPFLNRDLSPIEVRTKTAVEYVEVTRELFAEVVRLHPAMASGIASLVARKNRKPAGTAPAPAAKPSDLSGRLDVVPIADLIQVLHICRKSGHLRLAGSAHAGGIFVAEGELKHAWTAVVQGEAAFWELMGLDGGTFSFESGAAPDVVTLNQPTMLLVMESARRVDERRRGGA